MHQYSPLLIIIKQTQTFSQISTKTVKTNSSEFMNFDQFDASPIDDYFFSASLLDSEDPTYSDYTPAAIAQDQLDLGFSFCLPEFRLQPSVTEEPRQSTQKPASKVIVGLGSTCKQYETDSETHSQIYEEVGDKFSNSNQTKVTQESSKDTQSKLHNCPKHLIKVLALALELNDKVNTEKTVNFVFSTESQETLKVLKGLMNLIFLSFKGKIKSTSKELLKIIFEEGAEHCQKFRLLKLPEIQAVFLADADSISRAKSLLRQYTLQKLKDASRMNLIGGSRIVKKNINEMYVDAFMKELQSGSIRERICKAEKLKILSACSTL